MQAWVATRKGLFDLLKTDAGWRLDQLSFAGDPVTQCLADPRDGALYAALNLGHFGVKLHRRTARSRDWIELAVPAYPAQPPLRAGEAEWKLKQIWALAAGGRNESGVLWAGTLPGGLFRSSDAGLSWELVRSLWDRPERMNWMGGGNDTPGIHSICVDTQDSQKIVIAISCGGVWKTVDGGAAWALSAKGMRATFMPPEQVEQEDIQDPHRVVQCTTAPHTLWCQHHCGIWKSADYAASWQQQSLPDDMSDFGFAVAVHPRNPDVAWFAPAEADMRRIPAAAALSVTRTQDGGKIYQSLRIGLPQTDCYDLIYRHGLAVSTDGMHLLMASTTGNLWASTDAGETWLNVAGNLPPVYALGFA